MKVITENATESPEETPEGLNHPSVNEGDHD